MTEINATSSDQYPVCPADISNIKNKLAEAIELCRGDYSCLLKLNQVLSEATILCNGAMSQIDNGASKKT